MFSLNSNICHYSKRAWTCHPAILLCKRPWCFDSTSKTYVRHRIFKLSPIYASLIYQISWIQWIPVPFIKTFCAILSFCTHLHSSIFGFRLSDGLTKWSCFALVSRLSPTVSLEVIVTSCARVPLVVEIKSYIDHNTVVDPGFLRGGSAYPLGDYYLAQCLQKVGWKWKNKMDWEGARGTDTS